ncbi:glycosyltransferase family 4 protein [Patescibacteria group bacterium]|nr:glycosyltransferase family 4 protein [Patescibacteria group bacterium]
MKVAIDISQSIYGTGVSVYTLNLVSNLINEFPNDEFILFGGSLRRKKELIRIAKRLKAKSVIFPFPPRLMDFIWNSLHILPVERLIGHVDLIHTSDWTEPPSSIPKITTVHDLVPFKFPHTSHQSIRNAHKKRLSWIAKESKAIIAVSQSTKKDLVSVLKIPEEKITVIYEAAENLFTPQPPTIINAIKRRYKLNSDYIFSLSTLEPRKNQSSLIKAFNLVKKTYPDLKLVIGGRSGWGEELEKQKGIFFLGFIPNADLPSLYSGCLVYALPSFYEGFSLSQLQAMSCGAPVVTSNVSSMPEVVGKAGILVDPKSVDSIAAGIIKAIKNRATLSEKGLERSKEFSWQKTAKETHDLYEKILSRKY